MEFDKLLSLLPQGLWELRGPMTGSPEGSYYIAKLKLLFIKGNSFGNYSNRYIYAKESLPSLCIISLLNQVKKIKKQIKENSKNETNLMS